MTFPLDRRMLLRGGMGLAFVHIAPAKAGELASAHRKRPHPAAVGALTELEKKNGGRLGVAALDTASKVWIRYRASERFPMCSTHKVLTVAAILSEVDRGKLTLDHHVSYGRDDLQSYAPIARKHIGDGYMTVSDLCAAVLQWSDNTADNLLLKLIGGPAGWTRYARSIGDQVSRLDRYEPALNTSIPGDPRDTSTPATMVGQLDTLLLGKPLSEKSRKQLSDWLFGTQITGNLLHAGLPKGWRVGDKSGSGERGSRNDIGILLPPRGAPIVVAVLYTGSEAAIATREHVIAEVGRVISDTFAA